MSFFDRWILNLQNNKIPVEYKATAIENDSSLLCCTIKTTFNNQPLEISRLSTHDNHLQVKDILMGELLKYVSPPLPFTE